MYFFLEVSHTPVVENLVWLILDDHALNKYINYLKYTLMMYCPFLSLLVNMMISLLIMTY